MTTKTLHFSISGDYITDIVRQVWVEGDMTKAIHILKSGFPMFEMDLIMDIILGKKKLVGINEMTIEDDDTTECYGIPLLSMDQQIANKEKALKEREDKILAMEQMNNGEIEKIASVHGLIPVPCSLLQSYPTLYGTRYGFKDGFTIEMYEELFPDKVEEAKKKLSVVMFKRRIKDTMIASGLNARLAGDLVEDPISAIDKTTGMAKLNDGIPKVDKDLDGLNGWISPDGDFYSCGFMGHIDLADRLGFKEGEIEKTWVKVRDRKDPNAAEFREFLESDFSFPCLSGGLSAMIMSESITQSQYNTIFSWCQKHNRNMPEDIEEYVKKV
jgi:hypothetical protein